MFTLLDIKSAFSIDFKHTQYRLETHYNIV